MDGVFCGGGGGGERGKRGVAKLCIIYNRGAYVTMCCIIELGCVL